MASGPNGLTAVLRLPQTPVRYLKTLLLPVTLLLLALIVWRVTCSNLAHP